MSRDPYVRAMERMNMNVAKHPPTQAMLDFLKDVFTKEQAALIGDFPLGAYTAEALSKELGRDLAELEGILVQMSQEGLIFEAKSESGGPEYSVLPFEPGIAEFQTIHGREDDKTRRRVQLWNKVHEEEGAFLKEALKEPELLRAALTDPPGRLIPIEETVAHDKEVACWERLSSIIEEATSFALGHCACRQMAKLNGHTCKTGVDNQCCIYFDKMADYLVERNYAKRATKEEVYELIKECNDAGCVNFVPNRLDIDPLVVCNCCGCCCGYLEKVKVARDADVNLMDKTNFRARVDEDTCTGCGECVEYCQLEALSLDGDVVRINEKYCMGCGVCISKCPMESLSLERVSSKKPIDIEIKLVGAGT